MVKGLGGASCKNELDLEQGCRVFLGQTIEVNKRSRLGQNWGNPHQCFSVSHMQTKHLVMLLKCRFWDFPGSPMVRTLHFHCKQGERVQSLVGELNPTWCLARPKKKRGLPWWRSG